MPINIYQYANAIPMEFGLNGMIRQRARINLLGSEGFSFTAGFLEELRDNIQLQTKLIGADVLNVAFNSNNKSNDMKPLFKDFSNIQLEGMTFKLVSEKLV